MAPPRGASACSLAVAAAVLLSLGNVAAGVGGTASALPISVSARARLQIWEGREGKEVIKREKERERVRASA